MAEQLLLSIGMPRSIAAWISAPVPLHIPSTFISRLSNGNWVATLWPTAPNNRAAQGEPGFGDATPDLRKEKSTFVANVFKMGNEGRMLSDACAFI